MRNRKSLILYTNICGWVVLSLSFALIVFTRFANPAMTETQLFINYLPVWILLVPTIIIGYKLAVEE